MGALNSNSADRPKSEVLRGSAPFRVARLPRLYAPPLPEIRPVAYSPGTHPLQNAGSGKGPWSLGIRLPHPEPRKGWAASLPPRNVHPKGRG